MDNQQVQSAVGLLKQALVILDPSPVGHPPRDMQDAALAYVVSHLAITPAEFDKAFTSEFATAALVERNSEVDPQGAAPIYDGTPLGVAAFDAATTDDTTVDVFAFKGTANVQSIRHAIINSRMMTGNGKEMVFGIAEVWGWKRDGIVYNLKTGLRIGATPQGGSAPPESVLVSGSVGSVLV